MAKYTSNNESIGNEIGDKDDSSNYRYIVSYVIFFVCLFPECQCPQVPQIFHWVQRIDQVGRRVVAWVSFHVFWVGHLLFLLLAVEWIVMDLDTEFLIGIVLAYAV